MQQVQQLQESSGWEMRVEEVLASWEQIAELPSVENLICILQQYRKKRNLLYAKHMHMFICDNGLEAHRVLGNYLVPMFVECGSLSDAQHVFNRLPHRNEYSWTSLIQGYIEYGEPQYALDLYWKMQQECVHPSRYTFVVLLKACSKLKCVERGRELHAVIAEGGCERDIFVYSTLVDMYAKWGSLAEAREVFDNLPIRNVVLWTALIAGYAEHGCGKEALNCFQQMQLEGISPNAVTFVCSLKACGIIGAMDRGREIHAEIVNQGFEREPFIGSTLVDMYAKCGLIAEAQEVFYKLPVRNVVTWNALIAGYTEHGLGEAGLNCLELMQLEGIPPDTVTFIYSLKACCSIGDMKRGQKIHAEIAKEGCERDHFVGSTIVDMYAKCGLLAEAQEVFDKLSVQDVVLWNALIAGYAEHGLGEEALNCFQQMELEGVSPDVVSWSAIIFGYADQGDCEKALKVYAQMQEQGISPNSVTFVSILKACGSTTALKPAQKVHAQICRFCGQAPEIILATALVDMYGKCGSMVDAQQVFDTMPARFLVTWNSLITGYASQGDSEIVFHFFERMRKAGIQPDGITFLSVLTVCSHAGLVDGGQECFEAMSQVFGIMATIKHHNCMIDLLCRAGRFNEALMMLEKMPFQPDLVMWSTMLGACQKWGNVELGI